MIRTTDICIGSIESIAKICMRQARMRTTRRGSSALALLVVLPAMIFAGFIRGIIRQFK